MSGKSDRTTMQIIHITFNLLLPYFRQKCNHRSLDQWTSNMKRHESYTTSMWNCKGMINGFTNTKFFQFRIAYFTLRPKFPELLQYILLLCVRGRMIDKGMTIGVYFCSWNLNLIKAGRDVREWPMSGPYIVDNINLWEGNTE